MTEGVGKGTFAPGHPCAAVNNFVFMTPSSFMRQTDAFTWYMEDDPESRSTVVAVAWLQTPPAWDDLVLRLERATRLVPSFRQRLVEVPGRLATPRWTTDAHFDLAWHLRRVDAPAPHGRDQVLELAALAAMSGFDRTGPLWEFTLVEGLEDGRAALIDEDAPLADRRDRGVQLARPSSTPMPRPTPATGE